MAVIKSSAIVSSINTIFLIALSYIISIINNDKFLSPKTHKFFIKISRNAAIIYLLLSIILFTILFINKSNEKILKNNKKEEIED